MSLTWATASMIGCSARLASETVTKPYLHYGIESLRKRRSALGQRRNYFKKLEAERKATGEALTEERSAPWMCDSKSCLIPMTCNEFSIHGGSVRNSHGRDDNCIILGSIVYGSEGGSDHLPGMSHPVWWPLSASVVRDLILKDVIVTTVFNPAYLKSDLESHGFQVEGAKPWEWQITKRKADGRVIRIHGISYYLHMIQSYLLSEESVVSTITETVSNKLAESRELPMRIDLHIEQRFGVPPN